MIEPPNELLEFIEPYSRGVQELTLALRQLVIEELAPCTEYILQVYTISLIYGPTSSMKDSICYIALARNHINLGFNHGTSLSDRSKILEGDGKQMRHIKFAKMSDIERPAIRAYLGEACELAGHDVSSATVREVITSVKPKSQPKRLVGTARL